MRANRLAGEMRDLLGRADIERLEIVKHDNVFLTQCGTRSMPYNSLSARSTTFSTVKPKWFSTSCDGAEAPNVFIPMISPSGPTHRYHDNDTPASIASRRFIARGNTESR